MILIVGLGNPGRQYRGTRHNMGFLILDRFSRDHSLSITLRKFSAKIGTGMILRKKVLLARPMTFMNLSGESVAPLTKYFKISLKDIVVVHDDLDLTFGRMKIAAGGGDGGHQGVRSIIEALGSRDFIRVRVGIGRPPERMTATDYVLQEFSAGEKRGLREIVLTASHAVETILAEGVVTAMNQFNR